MMISILLLLATLIQGTSMVTDKVWTCVMPAEANLPSPLFVPLSTRVLKSEVLPFDLTWFNQTPMPATDVEPQLIVETTDMHFFFVVLSVAATITAAIVAAVLLIFMFFMFAAFLFTKKNQKPRKITKKNKQEKECNTCCDCCFIYLYPEQLQLVPPPRVEQVSQVVVEEEVIVEVEATNEIIPLAPLLPSQQHQPPLQLQQAPPVPNHQQQTPLAVPPPRAEQVSHVVVEEEVIVEVEATNEIIPLAPLLPSQQHQPPLQLQQASPVPTQQQQTPLQSLQVTLPPSPQHQTPLQSPQPTLPPSQQIETVLQSPQATLPPTQQQQTPLQLQQAPPLPCQQQHSLPQQLRRSSRLAGKPPVDFRPFF